MNKINTRVDPKFTGMRLFLKHNEQKRYIHVKAIINDRGHSDFTAHMAKLSS